MSRFFKNFLGVSVQIAVVPALLVTALLFFIGKANWLLLLWLTIFWIFINNFAIFYLLDSIQSGKFDPKKILILSLIKFPLLYGVGVLIIIGFKNNLEGMLIGFTIYLLSAPIAWFLSRVKNNTI